MVDLLKQIFLNYQFSTINYLHPKDTPCLKPQKVGVLEGKSLIAKASAYNGTPVRARSEENEIFTKRENRKVLNLRKNAFESDVFAL